MLRTEPPNAAMTKASNEEILLLNVRTQTCTPRNLSSLGELDSDENRAL